MRFVSAPDTTLVGELLASPDEYVGMLIVMALTGIFLVRGRKGLTGRGECSWPWVFCCP
ncbi:MAG: hypothetical protein KAH56_10885 [Candidatus Krumholzibacteria bacterium]|nr:hypothetical protein [Candidatus Krumholzibacteria bacterium]